MNQRLARNWICLLWSLFVLDSAGAQEQITFYSTESPPIWSAQLPQGGLGSEILHAAAHAASLKATIHYLPLARYEQLAAGNRLGNPLYFVGQEFGAVVPLIATHAVFCYYQPHHAEEIQYRSLADLKGMTLGVIRGTLEDIEAFRTRGVAVEESTTLDALFRKLRAGRVDLVLVIDVMAHYQIERLFPGESERFLMIEVPNGITPVAVMLDQQDPNAARLGAAIRQGMNEIINDGSYYRILTKYYGAPRVPRNWLEQLRLLLTKYQNSPVTVHAD